MLVFGRPRAAALFPFLAVVTAASLLLLVALSIALQPPATAGMDAVARTLAWARAALFSAGAAAFLVGMVSFARAGSFGAGEGERGGVAAPDRPSPRQDEMPESRAEALGATPRQTNPTPTAENGPRFTLIALGATTGEVRAIADFDDATHMLQALRDWREQHPDEEFRIYTGAGVQVARRRPPEPAAFGDAPPTPALEARAHPLLIRRRGHFALGGMS